MANELKMAIVGSILQLRALNWSARRIAPHLGIDRSTVRKHLRRAGSASELQNQPFRPPGRRASAMAFAPPQPADARGVASVPAASASRGRPSDCEPYLPKSLIRKPYWASRPSIEPPHPRGGLLERNSVEAGEHCADQSVILTNKAFHGVLLGTAVRYLPSPRMNASLVNALSTDNWAMTTLVAAGGRDRNDATRPLRGPLPRDVCALDHSISCGACLEHCACLHAHARARGDSTLSRTVAATREYEKCLTRGGKLPRFP
jgi:hypothetical protein